MKKTISSKSAYGKTFIQYIEDVENDNIIVGEEIKLAVKKFKRMLKDPEYEFRQYEPDKICYLMENFCFYHSGEDMEGNSLLGKSFKLSPYQVFCVYCMDGFYYKGTIKRVVKKALITMGRKNGKSRFLSAYDFALSIKNGKDGYSVLVVADLKDHSKEVVDEIQQDLYELYKGDKVGIKKDNWRLISNNDTSEIVNQNWGGNNKKKGLRINIRNAAGGVNGIHGEKKKLINLDEIHNMGGNAEIIVKQASNSTMNNVATGLTIMTTTAGKGFDSYCYRLIESEIQKLKEDNKENDHMFAFICKAEEINQGEVDFLDRDNWYKANPNINISFSEKVLEDKMEDLKDSKRAISDFIAYNLNVYQSDEFGEFNPDYFSNSDMNFNYTLQDLKNMNLTWFGGADLSTRDDMTATALYTEDENGNAYIIPHAFIPETTVKEKKRLGGMDIDGWVKEKSMTICENDIVNMDDVVDQFLYYENIGFNIKEVGYDKALADTFEIKMTEKGFDIYKQAQTHSALNRGFYRIEEKALDGKLYFLHSDMFMYNVNNLLVKRKSRNVEFSKVSSQKKIDAFAAAVDACIRYLWWNEQQKEKNKKKMKKQQTWETFSRMYGNKK